MARKRTKIWVLFATTFCIMIMLLGCQSFPEKVEVEPAKYEPRAYPEPEVRLGPGDTLEIRFFYTPELNVIQTIRPDGKIMLQLVGDVEAQGKTLVISSHVLEEVERITDNILLINKGRLLAEGRIQEIRDLIDKYPHNILIRTPQPSKLAQRLIREPFVLAVTKDQHPKGLMVQTHQPDIFYSKIAKIILNEGVEVSQMTSTDDNLDAVFRYLVE